jgi:hypothetical protein
MQPGADHVDSGSSTWSERNNDWRDVKGKSRDHAHFNSIVDHKYTTLHRRKESPCCDLTFF